MNIKSFIHIICVCLFTFISMFLVSCFNKKTNAKFSNFSNTDATTFDSIILSNPEKSDSISLAILNQTLASGIDSIAIEAYIARTSYLLSIGEVEKATICNTKCLELSIKNKIEIKILKCNYNKALIVYQESKFGESAKLFSNLLPKLLKEKQYYNYTKCKANLGWAYYNSSQLKLALAITNEAVLDAKKYKFDDLHNQFLQRLGSIYAQIYQIKGGDKRLMDTAFYYFKQCEKYLTSKNNESVEISLFYENMGNFHVINGSYTKSIEYFIKALEIQKKLNLELEIGYTYSNIGLAYQKLKQYSNGLDYLLKSKLIAEKYNDLELNSAATKNIAVLYEQQKDYKNATTYLMEYDNLYAQKINEEVVKSNNELNTKYQTEKKEKENTALKLEQLKLEKRNLSIIWICASSFVIISLVLWWQFLTRKRKKKIKALEDVQKLEAELSVQRKRFSRDLHDNIGSRTSLLIKNLETLKNEDSKDEINNLQNNATDILQNLRETVWAMNEGSISVESLADKITQFAQNRLPVDTEIKLDISQDIYEDKQLSAEDFLNFYRICQESINNAIKYSEADTLNLNILYNTNKILKIEIKDNGKGFEINFNSINHYGIQNMKNRAEESQIQFQINASRGTRISLEKQF